MTRGGNAGPAPRGRRGARLPRVTTARPTRNAGAGGALHNNPVGFRLGDDGTSDVTVAAPLLCAGITTYTPLRRWDAGPGRKVAVIGLGGLGQMAVKIAVATGAEVTVLSRTLAKKEDGLALGASSYVATEDVDAVARLAESFDVIVNTVSANLSRDTYLRLLRLLRLLRPLGALVNVGLPADSWTVRPGSLVGGRRVLAGSNIGGIPATQEMLDFCAENGIGAQIERIAADRVKRGRRPRRGRRRSLPLRHRHRDDRGRLTATPEPDHEAPAPEEAGASSALGSGVRRLHVRGIATAGVAGVAGVAGGVGVATATAAAAPVARL